MTPQPNIPKTPTESPTVMSALHDELVLDVVEHKLSNAKPPSPPIIKSPATPFPIQRGGPVQIYQRSPQTRSTFEINSSGMALSTGSKGDRPAHDIDQCPLEPVLDAKRRIDKDNQARLAQMSPFLIESARQDLFSELNPLLLERFLKRAKANEESVEMRPDIIRRDLPRLKSPIGVNGYMGSNIHSDNAVANATDRSAPATNDHSPGLNPSKDADIPTLVPVINEQSVSPHEFLPSGLSLSPGTHPAQPSLDLSDPNFLENLRANYFPEFQVDLQRHTWMAPLPSEGSLQDLDSPYGPTKTSFSASSIRFDFRGMLIPPRLARQIPTTEGLHHHGLAPEAAGYTLPELAHLSRSSFAAQRCVAYQTLGRILYRLSRGDFGDQDEDLYRSMWKCLDDGRVIETLLSEIRGECVTGRSLSCKMTAVDAVQLWQKGGRKTWTAN